MAKLPVNVDSLLIFFDGLKFRKIVGDKHKHTKVDPGIPGAVWKCIDRAGKSVSAPFNHYDSCQIDGAGCTGFKRCYKQRRKRLHPLYPLQPLKMAKKC